MPRMKQKRICGRKRYMRYLQRPVTPHEVVSQVTNTQLLARPIKTSLKTPLCRLAVYLHSAGVRTYSHPFFASSCLQLQLANTIEFGKLQYIVTAENGKHAFSNVSGVDHVYMYFSM